MVAHPFNPVYLLPLVELVAGNQTEDGVQMVIAGLRRRFGPLDIQTSISTIVELLTFRRIERESVDDAITRFEALRAHVAGLDDQFVLPTPVLSLLFLVSRRR